ncbi:Hypothetical protein D9617_3g018810 [Elsinoe fawcettii]|nr:Hypothetical protein D9617_3g018810 [Elsinoe fawcettii]
MASSDTQNVVVNSQSVDTSSIDAHAKTNNTASALNGTSESSAPAVQEPSTSDIAEVNDNSALANGKIGAQSHQTDSLDAHVNGNGLHTDHLSVADTASVQGSVPDIDSRDAGSVGDAAISDTDSRGDVGDTGEAGKDANGNTKLGSLKKPTTFKAVSVTKNFLAKTATSTPSVKLGEKLTAPAVSSPQTMARPRLVAKSGSGLRDTPRPRTGTEGPSEGSTVWNKNRPAPPPPPKQFTDEELKQQYGIHLASRIQADEGSKQSKWADIDDEEDDWAPETIEWMDGTKSKTNPEPVPAVKPVEDARPLETKTNMTPLQRPVATGPPKTILRPGAAQQVKLEAPNGNNTSDQKVTLGAKAAAPVPVKSPWAALPPVDKSTPMFQPPPPPAPPSKPAFGSQDARFMDDSSASTRHEIEADTFDRSWRDSNGPRELFNSQSGRYEPAPEGGRRGSVRHDQGYRQSAVLQRPSEEEIYRPHQQVRADGSPWTRRRSSMSQSTQSFERRVSIPPSTDTAAPTENRTGIVIGHDIGPQGRKPSDAAQKLQQQINDRNEELAKQKRIMQEKREAAIRRREEEVQREEAEKQERIRIKMQSLPPLAKKESEQEVDNVETPPQPITTPAPSQEVSAPAPPPLLSEQSERNNNGQHNSHNTSPVKAQPLENVRSDPGTQQRPSQTPFTNQAARPPTSIPNRGFQDASLPVSSYSSPGEQKAQPIPFKSPALVADSFATWGNRSTPSHASPASNVWGPPGATRGIGNGAFDSSFARIPPRLQNQNIMGQAFGPQNNRSPSAGNRQQETSPMRHQQMLSDQNLAALGLVDTPTDSFPSAASAGPSPMPAQAHPMALSPIGPPPNRQVNQPFQQQVPPRGPAAWGNFAATAPNEPRPVAKNHSNSAQQWEETFEQTKTKTGNWGGARKVVQANEAVYTKANIHAQAGHPAQSPAPPVAQTQPPANAQVAGGNQESTVRLPSGPAAFVKAQPPQTPLQPRTAPTLPPYPVGAYQSKFFPISVQYGSPPPEEASHPAQSGDKAHPKVNLPQPKIKVRLPQFASPAANIPDAQPSPVTMPQRTPSYRGAQPIVQTSHWQARFNGLFGRADTTTITPPSPPKTPPKMEAMPSPAPVSSSKADVFDAPAGASATVSLPNKVARSTSPPRDMDVKPAAEVLFDGELSFGSTPKVAVPNDANYEFGPERKGNGPHLLRMYPNPKFDRRVVSVTMEIDMDTLLDVPSTIATIKLSADEAAKDVPLPVRITKYKFNDKRKVSGKFGKSPKIGVEKENEGSPMTTPVKLGDRVEKIRMGKPPQGPKGFTKRTGSGKWGSKSGEASPGPAASAQQTA